MSRIACERQATGLRRRRDYSPGRCGNDMLKRQSKSDGIKHSSQRSTAATNDRSHTFLRKRSLSRDRDRSFIGRGNTGYARGQLSTYYRNRFGSQSPEIYQNLRLTNFDKAISDDELRTYLENEFKRYGDMSVRIVRHDHSDYGEERLAYVNFERPGDARQAKRATQTKIKAFLGKFLRIDPAGVIRDQSGRYLSSKEGSSSQASNSNDRDRPGRGRAGSVGGVGNGRGHSSNYSTSSRNNNDTATSPSPPSSHRGGGARSSVRRLIDSPTRSKENIRDAEDRVRVRRRPGSGAGSGMGSGSEEMFAVYSRTPNRTLFIGNLAAEVTVDVLQRLCRKYGIIENIDMKKQQRHSSSSNTVTGGITNGSQGAPFAFVRFQNLDMSEAAKLQLADQDLCGNRLKVGYGRPSPTRRLWVGGLGAGISMHIIECEFDRFGVIEKIDFVKGENHAYILFDNTEAAIAAQSAMNGFTLKDSSTTNSAASGATTTGSASAITSVEYKLRVDFASDDNVNSSPNLATATSRSCSSSNNDNEPSTKVTSTLKRSRNNSRTSNSSDGSRSSNSCSPPPAKLLHGQHGGGRDKVPPGISGSQQQSATTTITVNGGTLPSGGGPIKTGPVGRFIPIGSAPAPSSVKEEAAIIAPGCLKKASTGSTEVSSASGNSATRRLSVAVNAFVDPSGDSPLNSSGNNNNYNNGSTIEAGYSTTLSSAASQSKSAISSSTVVSISGSSGLKKSIDLRTASSSSRTTSSSSCASDKQQSSPSLDFSTLDLTSLDKFLSVCKPHWTGGLILKKSLYPMQLVHLKGLAEMVPGLLGLDAGGNGANGANKPGPMQLTVSQRLPLTQPKLEDAPKWIQSSDRFFLVAVPTLTPTLSSNTTSTIASQSQVITTPESGPLQTRSLKLIVKYFKEKAAAGVVNLAGGGVLYAFPSCTFVGALLDGISPPGLRRVFDAFPDDCLLLVVSKAGTQ